jgi:hypothetical protein
MTARLWELDWEFETRELADWDEGARHHLVNFLSVHSPHSHLVLNGQEPTQESAFAISRHNKLVYSEADFTTLLHTLSCAGYGWVKAEGVRRELNNMANTWPETADSRELL